MSNPKKRHETVKFDKDDLTRLLSLEAQMATVTKALQEINAALKERIKSMDAQAAEQHRELMDILGPVMKDVKELVPTVATHGTYFRIAAYVLGGLVTIPGLWGLLRWWLGGR